MVQIFARKPLRYQGKEVAAGEPFDASDKDAKLLCAIRKASRGPESAVTDLPHLASVAEAAPEVVQPDPLIAPEHVEAAEEAAPEAPLPPEEPSPAPARKGRLNRRDLRA